MELLYLLYMLLLCGFLPLYMNAGYYELGEAKALCYLVISIPFVIILLIRELVRYRKEAGEEGKAPDNNIDKFFLYGTLFSCFISWIFSVDKKVAFFGYEGWRNGLLTTLVAISFCIFISKSGFFKSQILALFLLVPFFEFALSILNRMSIFPFMIAGQNSSFVATIGNINWFSGFLSIWVPLGVGFMFVQKRFSFRFFLLGIYTIVGLVALFLQGSEGAGLIICACYGLLLWYGTLDRENFKAFLIQAIVLGISMSIVDILMMFAGSYYNYSDNLLLVICRYHVGAIIIAAAFFIYRVSRLFEEIKVSFYSKTYKKIYIVVMVAALATAIVLLIMNFSEDFGNGRGIIWRMCAEIYAGLSPWQKLVGIGQDCLYPYAMSDGYWNSSFTNVFNGAALTNAHCELLTVLLERGLIGAITYLGLFIFVIFKLAMAKEKEHAKVICALPVISYFIFNQISFPQVTSMPYCLILIGIAINLSGGQESE